MISKEALGQRVREIRQRRKMTLKDVETTSGLSATHISEIERGMTSPTVGALIRLSSALQKDPGFFVEPRELDEVSVTSGGDRPPESSIDGFTVTRGRCESLTRGVLGGQISVHEVKLEAGGRAEVDWLREGEDVCFYCIEGQVELGAGSQILGMGAGDSVHGNLPEVPCRLEGGGAGGRLLLIVDLKGTSRRPSGT
jgi:hypothetical protein